MQYSKLLEFSKMKIGAITPTFTSSNNKTEKKKSDFLSKFHEKTRNAADMNDTVIVPRTIFKGYLGIMAGTSLMTIGSLLNKHPKIGKPLNITGVLASLYGTWAFVRPFIIKDSNEIEKQK